MPDSPIAASIIPAQAFRFMELAPPSSLDDDSPQAQDIREMYPLALRSCLETCDWSFADTYAQLSAVVPPAGRTADPDLPHFYALPGDLVRVHEVQPCTRWRIDKTHLRTDGPGVVTIRYTALVNDEATLPATFQIAVAYRLASYLAPRWVGVRSKAEMIEAHAKDTLGQAQRDDARNASSSRFDGLPDTLSDDWVAGAVW